jgi:peptidoglycan-associated lipoprotein
MEEVMKKVLILMALVSVSTLGCKKDPPPTNTAGDITPVAAPQATPTSTSSGKTEVATGDMRDILLALKRVHFAFDSSALNDEAKNALDEAAEKLRAHPEVALFVDGHTDSQGTTEYNMSLGDRRADSVVGYLSRSGVESSRLTKVSFGEEHPMAKGGGAQAHAKNRRVEYRLMRGEIELVLEETTPIIREKEEETAESSETAPAPAESAANATPADSGE